MESQPQTTESQPQTTESQPQTTESQPQNPEFRNNPKNFHQCIEDSDQTVCMCPLNIHNFKFK